MDFNEQGILAFQEKRYEDAAQFFYPSYRS